MYVCDGDTVKSVSAQKRLQALAWWEGDIVVLTDPDAGGRMLRLFLDDTLRQIKQQQQLPRHNSRHQQQLAQPPTLLHAFVPIIDAISTSANR